MSIIFYFIPRWVPVTGLSSGTGEVECVGPAYVGAYVIAPSAYALSYAA